MVVGINSNLAASSASSNLGKANSVVQDSIARLSSGNRIIKASDDAAGLAIGTSISTTVTTLEIALLNTEQARSVLQIADGALSQLSDITARQKALATQSNSGSISNTERGYLNQEFTALTSEIDRIVTNTNFNGITLLDGTVGQVTEAGTSADLDATAPAAGEYTVIGTAGAAVTGSPTVGAFDDVSVNSTGFGTFSVVSHTESGGTSDSVVLQTQIGDKVYQGTLTASGTSGLVAASAALTFTELGSGSSTFSLSLAGSANLIDNATAAGSLATALTTSLSGLDIYQDRVISSTATPDADLALAGVTGDVTVVSNNFDLTNDAFGSIGEFTVTAGTGAANSISVDVTDANGTVTTFSANNVGGTTDETITIDLDGLSATITDLSDATVASGLETALNDFFGVSVETTTGAGLDFQVGSSVTDTISINITSAASADLYVDDAGDAQTLSIDTQENAQTAIDVLDNAIANIVAKRADIGASISRFDFAASNIEVSVANQDNARGSFLDADIANESTSFATAQVKLQASVSVLAQANQLPSNLLQLLQ